MKFTIQHIKSFPKWLFDHFELLFWVTAMILLFLLNETGSQSSFCLLKRMGSPYCPGCGIGHAIHYALRLQFVRSFQLHPFGIPAVLIIFMRIKQLLFKTTYHYEA